MKKIKLSRWTIMLMSDAQQPVLHFRFPKLLVYFFVLSIITLLIMLVTSYQVTKELQKEKVIAERNLNEIESKHKALLQEAVEIQEKIEELKELELQMREAVKTLKPGISKSEALAVPMGGLEEELEQDAPLLDTYQDIKSQLPDLIERSEDTLSHVEKLSKELKLTPTLWPTNTRKISSPFGNRRDPFTNRPSMHSGVDIVGPFKTPIYATADGTVALANYHGGYGKLVIIRHSGKYSTRYAHLANYIVSTGEKVKKGQVIGYMGSTGRSTGVHLHYEILKYGNPVDPYPYMSFSK